MIDVISRGRLEMGFVKGVPYEIHPANSLPVRHTDRFWEAHDLILKAMTTHDGPFSWEGEFFQYRNVNVWPRPYQQPHPPVWISANSVPSASPIAQRGHVLGTVMTGYKAKALFDEYRRVWRERQARAGAARPALLRGLRRRRQDARGRPPPRQHGDGLSPHQRHRRRGVQNPPGFIPARCRRADDQADRRSRSSCRTTSITKDGRNLGAFSEADLECTIDGGLMFTGTPDDVYARWSISTRPSAASAYYLMMAQAGTMILRRHRRQPHAVRQGSAAAARGILRRAEDGCGVKSWVAGTGPTKATRP